MQETRHVASGGVKSISEEIFGVPALARQAGCAAGIARKSVGVTALAGARLKEGLMAAIGMVSERSRPTLVGGLSQS